MRISKKQIVGVLSASAILLAIGCGSATNNDQGVSVTLSGFFEDAACGTGLEGVALYLSSIQEGVAMPKAAIQVMNNLKGQGIRIDRLLMTYHIEGSMVQPPATNTSLSMVLSPGATGGSSLPGSFGVGAKGCSQFWLLPPEVTTYLSLNKSDFPEAPYLMVMTAVATGVTTAGDRIETNPLSLDITVMPDEYLPGTSGTDSSSSASTASTDEDTDESVEVLE